VPRPKRKPDEIRELLLRAGVHCFAGHGFAGATTRQIAAEAGVSEMLLYRHFGNKAGLFEAAVVAPFKTALEAHVEKWDSAPDDVSAEDITTDFLANVYGLLSKHRDIMLALVAAHAHEHEVGGSASGLFAEPVERIVKFIERLSKTRGYSRVDAEVATQAVLSMVMGMALLDDLLLRPGHAPSVDRRIREMTQLIVHGMTHRS
jgi:AcrR family transcriptional regulator